MLRKIKIDGIKYRVYGTRVNEYGNVEFLIYCKGQWQFVNSIFAKPCKK